MVQAHGRSGQLSAAKASAVIVIAAVAGLVILNRLHLSLSV